nr:hypothetical protein [Hankyongella ginsenosidimutans]
MPEIFFLSFDAPLTGLVVEAGDTDGRIDHEAAKRFHGHIALTLEQGVHEGEGFLQVVEAVGDAAADKARKRPAIGLGDRLQQHIVETSVHLEDEAIVVLERIADLVRAVARGGVVRRRVRLRQDQGSPLASRSTSPGA